MKTMLKHFFLMGLVAFFCGCGESEDDIDPVFNGDLILEVDQPEITTSEFSVATFTVKYKGEDVTKASRIYERNTQTFVKNSRFNSAKAGSYVFKATYEGAGSEEINLTVKEETYFKKNVLLQNLTSTDCKNCPVMEQNIGYFDGQYPKRLIVMAIHGHFTVPDPFALPPYYEPIARLFEVFQLYPVCLFDQELSMANDPVLSTRRLEECLGRRGNIGIALSTNLTTNKVDIDVRIKSTDVFEKPLYLAVALVESNLLAEQRLSETKWTESIFDNVLRKYLTDVFGDELKVGDIERGKEFTTHYEYIFPDNSQFTEENQKLHPENMTAIVYVLNEKKVVLNCQAIYLGGEIDYQY